MRWTIHRIENVRRYDVPGHTAYLKAFRRPCLGFSRRNRREPVENRQSLRLPDQSHRQDISMRTKRPNFHSSVDSVALFTPMGLIPDAGPLQSKFFVSQT